MSKTPSSKRKYCALDEVKEIIAIPSHLIFDCPEADKEYKCIKMPLKEVIRNEWIIPWLQAMCSNYQRLRLHVFRLIKLIDLELRSQGGHLELNREVCLIALLNIRHLRKSL